MLSRLPKRHTFHAQKYNAMYRAGEKARADRVMKIQSDLAMAQMRKLAFGVPMM
jgi:hypothetical protein